MGNDVRYALRLLRRSPGFTAVAVLSLAFGIGANTAIFSLVDSVMLRTLPVERPHELVELMQKYPGEPRGNGGWSWAALEHYRESNHVFAALTGFSTDNLLPLRTEGGEAEPVFAEFVPGDYFAVLGVQPGMGRLIAPDDVPQEGIGPVAVLSWHCWQTRFQGDKAILGRRVYVAGADMIGGPRDSGRPADTPVTIVGVGPRGFRGLRMGARVDLWLPRRKAANWLFGRLKPGVSQAQAQAEMSVLYSFTVEERASRSKDPKIRQLKMEVERAGTGDAAVRDEYGRPLTLLMGLVGLLLLIACINIASMLLARAAGRRREMAVRAGLGASRGQLVRLVLTESVLLSAAGALAGVFLAWAGTRVLVRIIESGREFERIHLDVQPDARVLLFTAGVAILTGLLFGLAPALYALRASPAHALRQGGRGTEGRTGRLFGKALVSAQVAFSILLLSAAVLFAGHLTALTRSGLGFDRDHVLLVFLDPAKGGYKVDQLGAPFRALLERLASLPGVRSASITACSPVQGCGASRFVTVEGYPERPEERRYVGFSFSAPGYFATLGIPLLAGRDFRFDDIGHARVTVISEGMARRYFPGADPVGRQIRVDGRAGTGGFDDSDRPYEVIGVAGDSKGAAIHEPDPPMMYLNMFQENRFYAQFLVRTAGEPAAASSGIRSAVREVMKNVPVTNMRTLGEQVDAAVVPERLIATLSGAFGGLGALIAGIGLYGLLAFMVARRVNEIGIRMALGATAGRVARMVLRDALGTVGAGVLAGTFMALWARGLAPKVLPGLAVRSAVPLALGAAVMLALAVAASWPPARRAAGVDPMEALREE